MVLYRHRRTHEQALADSHGDRRGAVLHWLHELPHEVGPNDDSGLLADQRLEEAVRGVAQAALPRNRQVQAGRASVEVFALAIPAALPPLTPQPGILKA